jgi:two-component system chemotaxis sensor kinase CheA
MAQEKLYYTFEQDTRSFIHQINDLLIRLENSGYNKEVINQIFRCIHSIKSEAAYLDLSGIAEAAHGMESAIEPLRTESGASSLNKELLEFCFSVIDEITTLMDDVKLSKTGDSGVISGPDSAGYDVQTDSAAVYDAFELILIKEARNRGELLYRLSFSISEEASMKFPRVYLAMSNLEMNHNVISVKPEIEKIDNCEDGRVSVVLSSAASDSLIIDEINIDQVENIEISKLSFDEELENLAVESVENAEQSDAGRQRIISVEASEIDAISEYVAEIKNRLADLSSVINDDEARDKLEADLIGLGNISDGIEKMMSNLQTVDFNGHFAGYRRTVRDLAARIGKKVEVEFDAGNIKMLRDFTDFIADPLLQLIRNAVVHGIETPQQRIAAEKNETGLIRVQVSKDEKITTISVKDDGRGITIDTDNERSLLDIITSPGFSTHNESSDYAGRGVGLDLVRTKILKRNGALKLINKPGTGCEFRMIFDEGKVEVPFLIIRTDDTLCAVKNVDAESVFTIRVEAIDQIDGNYCYNGEPLFNADGRLDNPGEKIEFHAFSISHLGKTGVLIFDEPLFEVHYNADSFSEGFDIGNYCRELIVNGKSAEYCLLSPQVIFD